MKTLHFFAAIFVLLALLGQDVPAPRKQSTARVAYRVCPARTQHVSHAAIIHRGPGQTVPVLASSKPTTSLLSAPGAEGRKRRRALLLRVLVLVLTVLALTLILAILSKAITLCVMESIVADHERQRGCKEPEKPPTAATPPAKEEPPPAKESPDEEPERGKGKKK